MNRARWLREKRRLNEERMDTLFAPDYDEHWGRIDSTHRAMLEDFLDLCPPECQILDAACGWTCAAGFEIIREVAGDGYHHVLAKGR